MLGKIWRRLSAIPHLLIALQVLRADAQAGLRDEKMNAAWAAFLSDPAIASAVPRFSAEWRDLESAIRQME